MKATLRVDDIPNSLNYYAGRTNKWEYREEKKNWKYTISMMARKLPQFDGKVTITLEYHFDTPNRRDPDNYTGKVVLDGLVDAGVIKDDSFRHVSLVLKAEFDAERHKKWMNIIIESEDTK